MEPFTDYDFVKRTQEILEQYDSLDLSEDKRYDVTLLINSCIGLLFFAKELGNLPLGEVAQYGLEKAVIRKNFKYSGETEMKSVCRHIRNSIAHKMFESSGRPISMLCMKDRNKAGKLTFHMEVNIDEFKNFVLSIAEHFLVANKK